MTITRITNGRVIDPSQDIDKVADLWIDGEKIAGIGSRDLRADRTIDASGMIVCPCSMGTLSAIAVGASRSLIERAADVTLKEQRKLVLVPRETPLSAIHLGNMLRLTRAGAVVMPAAPGFYHRPKEISDLVDFMVARMLDHLDVEQNLVTRWKGEMER